MDEEEIRVRLSALLDDELRGAWREYQRSTKPRWITDPQPEEGRVRTAVWMIYLLQQEAERRGISLMEETSTGDPGAPGVRPGVLRRQSAVVTKRRSGG